MSANVHAGCALREEKLLQRIADLELELSALKNPAEKTPVDQAADAPEPARRRERRQA